MRRLCIFLFPFVIRVSNVIELIYSINNGLAFSAHILFLCILLKRKSLKYPAWKLLSCNERSRHMYKIILLRNRNRSKATYKTRVKKQVYIEWSETDRCIWNSQDQSRRRLLQIPLSNCHLQFYSLILLLWGFVCLIRKYCITFFYATQCYFLWYSI